MSLGAKMYVGCGYFKSLGAKFLVGNGDFKSLGAKMLVGYGYFKSLGAKMLVGYGYPSRPAVLVGIPPLLFRSSMCHSRADMRGASRQRHVGARE
jgi:hypothetical protein